MILSNLSYSLLNYLSFNSQHQKWLIFCVTIKIPNFGNKIISLKSIFGLNRGLKINLSELKKIEK